MTTTRPAPTVLDLDVDDPFLPPSALVPVESRAAWADLANAVEAADAAEAALQAYIADNLRESTRNNERRRLIREGHPLARTAYDLDRARAMARDIFRMQMLTVRDAWEAHLDDLARRELDDAGRIVAEAAERIRDVALVPATHARRLAAFDRMAEGFAVVSWWAPAKRAAPVIVGARQVSLEREIIPVLEALAAQLTPAPLTQDTDQ